MATKSKKTEKKALTFNFKAIKTFEDACKKTGADPAALTELSSAPEELRKPLLAFFKLMIIYQAINNGWKPDWSNWQQGKYYPWYGVLSSGFGFSGSYYYCDYTHTRVGSRLCADSSEKALYIAKQFKELYQDYFLYTE